MGNAGITMLPRVARMAIGLDLTKHEEETQDTRTNPERGYFKWAVTLGFLVNPDQKETNPIEVLRSMKRN